MKRAARRQWALAAVVAALLAAAWWQVRSDQASAPGTLLPLKPGQITRVTLEVGRAPAMHYVKRQQHWWQIDPPARADDQRLQDLANIARAPVLSWQPAGRYDPAAIGLAPPRVRLELDGQTLYFGGMTAIGQNVYVQAGARVGIVSLRYMPRAVQDTSVQAQ
jgi:hypothetical protein